jgi:hypothetical protein
MEMHSDKGQKVEKRPRLVKEEKGSTNSASQVGGGASPPAEGNLSEQDSRIGGMGSGSPTDAGILARDFEEEFGKLLDRDCVEADIKVRVSAKEIGQVINAVRPDDETIAGLLFRGADLLIREAFGYLKESGLPWRKNPDD